MGLSSLKAFKRSCYQFINMLQDKLTWAYNLAIRAQEKEAKRHKRGMTDEHIVSNWRLVTLRWCRERDTVASIQ